MYRIFINWLKERDIQIYNYDEIGLNFKTLTTKTSAFMTESSALGYKKNQRIGYGFSLQ